MVTKINGTKVLAILVAKQGGRQKSNKINKFVVTAPKYMFRANAVNVFKVTKLYKNTRFPYATNFRVNESKNK